MSKVGRCSSERSARISSMLRLDPCAAREEGGSLRGWRGCAPCRPAAGRFRARRAAPCRRPNSSSGFDDRVHSARLLCAELDAVEEHRTRMGPTAPPAAGIGARVARSPTLLGSLRAVGVASRTPESALSGASSSAAAAVSAFAEPTARPTPVPAIRIATALRRPSARTTAPRSPGRAADSSASRRSRRWGRPLPRAEAGS